MEHVGAPGYNRTQAARAAAAHHYAEDDRVPIYDYQCLPNGHRFEVRHGINESPVTACPECGSPVRRVIHPVGIVFKGSGFYATDSRRPSGASKPATEGSASGESKAEAGGETKPAASESKTESKSESGSTS